MLNWFLCYLVGRHEYGVGCKPGTIFLRCVHCGRRSPGWEVERGKERPRAIAQIRRHLQVIATPAAPERVARVLPFLRGVAR
jgi:hypothetical protein